MLYFEWPRRKAIAMERYLEDRDPPDCAAPDVSSSWCLMRDIMRLYLLVRLWKPVFLLYSPNRAVSNMVRTNPITPPTKYVSHMTRYANGAPRSTCSEKNGTNDHMSCWSQTHTTSSETSHPQDRYLWTTFFSRFIWNFITWHSLFEHMFCLELGKICKSNT